MRYYLYLDREFLKSLCSIMPTQKFDVGIIELSSLKENTVTENITLNVENKKVNLVNLNNEDRVKNERRFFNIDEITNMKKFAFHDKLLNEVKKDKSTLSVTGNIEIVNYDDLSEDVFLKISNVYVWTKKSLFESSIVYLSNILQDITVVGYYLNEYNNLPLIRAIAIYK